MRNKLILDNIKPVFVVGHPRSGTTLMQLFLTAHPSFSSGPETHLFHYILKPPISDWRCAKLTLSDLEIVFKRMAGKPAIEIDEGFKKNIKNIAKDDGISPSLLLHELMTYFSKNSGVVSMARWVEKTPMHAVHALDILKIFPQSKIIHIIRDPRCVASSLPRFLNSNSVIRRQYDCLEKGQSWNKVAGLKYQFDKEERIINIFYEDIIDNAEGVLKTVMRFLDEEYKDDCLSYFSENYNAVALEKEHKRKSMCSSNKIIDRKQIWKNRMTKQEIKIVELTCEHLMKKLGYQTEMINNLSNFQKKLWLIFKKFQIRLAYSSMQLCLDLIKKISRLPAKTVQKLKKSKVSYM